MKNLKKLTASEIENTPFDLSSSVSALAGAALGTFSNMAVLDKIIQSDSITPMYTWDKEGMMKTRDRNGCYKNY